MSVPEVVLWVRLRDRPGGFKFRRQHPAGRHVLDFFCSEARLAIEIDGIAHDMGTRPDSDLTRDTWLMSKGVATLRIAARDVARDPDEIVESIVAACRAREHLLQRPTAAARSASRLRDDGLPPAGQQSPLRLPPRSGEEME